MRMEVYELFNGHVWAPLSVHPVEASSVSRLRKTGDRHWLQVPQYGKGFEIYDGTETHSVKVANLDGNVIPTPPHLIGVSIDKVDREDMYLVHANGRVSLQRESVPSMTPISMVCRCVDRTRLFDSSQISLVRRSKVRTLGDITISLPDDDHITAIRTLAERVVAGEPRGWEQVEAITQHLRHHYVVDRDSKAAEDSDSPVGDFLLKDKRGPEYLFASSAAVMLRSLGYSTRLVSGFYARPDKYDTRKQHTIVHAADAHFWCEVCIGADTWLTVEPSPGYEILTPPPGLLERLVNTVRAVWQLMTRHAIALTLTMILCVLAIANRKTLQSLLLTLRWKLSSRSSPQRRAIKLAVLVQHRLRLAGIRRQSGTTLRRWARLEPLESVRDELTRVAEIADQAFYDPSLQQAPVDSHELDQLESRLTFREFRTLRQQADNRPRTTQAL